MKYREGTISVADGSDVITGTGTAWLASVKVGQMLTFDGYHKALFVSGVTANGQLTVSEPIKGSGLEALSDLTYCIADDFTANYDIPVARPHDINKTELFARALNVIDDVVTS